MTTYTFNPYPPCDYYHPCGKCPYFEYPYCTYERKKKDSDKLIQFLKGFKNDREKI